MQAHAGPCRPVHAASVCTLMSVMWVSRVLFWECCTFPLVLTLSTSCSVGSLIPEWRDLLETSHLGLNVLTSLTLHVVWLSSLCLFPPAAGGSFSDYG